jgi:hypothetical protein
MATISCYTEWQQGVERLLQEGAHILNKIRPQTGCPGFCENA